MSTSTTMTSLPTPSTPGHSQPIPEYSPPYFNNSQPQNPLQSAPCYSQSVPSQPLSMNQPTPCNPTYQTTTSHSQHHRNKGNFLKQPHPNHDNSQMRNPPDTLVYNKSTPSDQAHTKSTPIVDQVYTKSTPGTPLHRQSRINTGTYY